MTRPINEIAREVRQDWKKLSPYAKPYLDAMDSLNDINGQYYADSAVSVVLYFLCNATTWRGDTARRVKAELNAMVKAKG